MTAENLKTVKSRLGISLKARANKLIEEESDGEHERPKKRAKKDDADKRDEAAESSATKSKDKGKQKGSDSDQAASPIPKQTEEKSNKRKLGRLYPLKR